MKKDGKLREVIIKVVFEAEKGGDYDVAEG